MSFTIRELTEADDPRRLELLNLAASEPATLDDLRAWRQAAPPDGIRLHVSAARDDGFIAGYAHVLRNPWLEPGLFWAHVAVDPAWRRQGLGARLFAHLRDFAATRGATFYRGEARESVPESLPFAERCGFSIERHIFESVLDLAAFDETRFARQVEGVQTTGIRFLTLAKAGDTEEARRRLHALVRTVAADIPGGSEAARWTFEDYQREVCATGFQPEAQFIAADGDEWVGMVSLQWHPGTEGAHNGMSGVRRAYRGRGIALALKLLAIRYARQQGARSLRTNNDSENAPMLAINRALGYQPEPGYYRLRRDQP